MARSIPMVAGLLAVLSAGGCGTYVSDYQYSPRPVLAEIPATQAGQTPPVAAWASIIGVRRADSKENLPACVEVRLRVENNGPQAVLFNPGSMDLSNGWLMRFPAPLLEPASSWNLAPAQSAVVTAYFPFSPGHSWDDTDLNSLQLQWQLQIEGRPVRQTAFFRRIPEYYDYGYPYAYPGYGWVGVGGIVVVHGHHR